MKNRRDFLRLTAFTLGGIAIGCGTSSSDSNESLDPDRGVFPEVGDATPLEPEDITDVLDGLPETAGNIEDIVAAFFDDDLESIHIIGQTYLLDVGELSPQEIAGRLSESLNSVTEVADPVAAGEALHQQVERDFTDVRLENVRGWWLAKTEVHLCALAFLLRTPDAPDASDLVTDVE